MKMLVLSQRMSRDSIQIETAAKKIGYKVVRVTSNNSDLWSKADIIVAYCEGFIAEYISQNSNMVLLRPLDHALAEAPTEIIKRRINHLKASDLPKIELPAFIKPSDQKFFTAGIYEDLSSLSEYLKENSEDSILVSEIVDFVDEYRHFCIEGKVITSSPYMLDREFVGNQEELPETPENVIQLAEEAYKSCSKNLPPACVIDIGVLDNGKCALIEFNPAWASGIYGADPSKALECISKSCINREKLSKELSKYETFDCSKIR